MLSEAKYEDSHGDISSSADMTVDAWFNYWISEIKAKTVRWYLIAAKESINYNHFLCILQTGVRSSELRGLKWDDIDFQNRIIHIRRNITHESNNNRFITGELKNSFKRRTAADGIIYACTALNIFYIL